MSKQKHFRPGEERATLRSVLIGVGGVLGITAAVTVLNPKMLHRPAPPPVPTLAQGQVAIAPISPAPLAAKAQEVAAAPEAPPASSQTFAPANPSEGNSEGNSETAAVQTPPSGETADLPQPAPQAHPIVHPAHPKKPPVAHHARPAVPAAGAGAQAPAFSLPPPPPVLPGGVVVGGYKPPGEFVSRQVTMAGLDLTTPLGACKAIERIRRTAEILCPYPDQTGLSFLRIRQRCVDESVDHAVKDLHVRSIEVLHAKNPEGC